MAIGTLRGAFAGLTLALTAALPMTVSAESLGAALTGAYNHSGLLDQNRALLRAADEDVAQANAALKPIINYTINSGVSGGRGQPTNSSTTLRITASLLVFDFGAAQYTIDRQKETVLATRQALIGVEQRVLQAAVDAYMDVVASAEQVSLRQSNVRLITQELRAARDRFEVGEVTRTDVALAESRLASARAGLAASEGSLARAVAAYREAVGHGPKGSVQPSSLPDLPASPAAARAIARKSHPSNLQARHEAEAADLFVLQAAAAVMPDLNFSASSTFSLSFDDDDTRNDTLGLELSGPIYQGGRITSQIRQAQARRDAAVANIHVVSHQVDELIEISYANLAVARASREASERQIRAARVAFRGVREEATLGARTTLDVLDAEQELLDAQANRITAITDEFKAAYGVLAATGLLTADHLGLNVQSYDPTGYYNLVKDSPIGVSDEGVALDRVLKALNKN